MISSQKTITLEERKKATIYYAKFDFLKDEGVEVVYLPRTPEISTTQIKNDLNADKNNA